MKVKQRCLILMRTMRLFRIDTTTLLPTRAFFLFLFQHKVWTVYSNFNATTAENSASHKYDVANEINVRKDLLATPGYSSFMLFQNPVSDDQVNFIRIEESDEMSINCSSSVIAKFHNGFSVNRFLIQLYCSISSGKHFTKLFLKVFVIMVEYFF